MAKSRIHDIRYEIASCAVCGGREARELANREGIRSEMEELWEFHERRLDPAVPLERLRDRVAFTEPPPIRLVKCARCGLVYRNPGERPRDTERRYEDECPPVSVMQTLHDAQRRTYGGQARRLFREIGPGGQGLEVGSYVGAFLSAARGAGLHFEGLDVNPEVNRFTRSLGFDVTDGTLEDVVPRSAFDAVAIWNTFDQLPDPRRAARLAWRLLRPDGVLAIRVPNGDFYARVRSVLAPGALVRGAHRLRPHPHRRWLAHAARTAMAHSNHLTFPYRYGFTPGSLSWLLRHTGYRVMSIRGEALVPTADDWTIGWAVVEERVVKAALRKLPAGWAPWIEVFARKEPPPGKGRRT